MYRQIHYRIYSTSYSTTSQYRMLASQLVVLCSIQIPTVVQVGIPTTAVLVQCRSSYYRYQQCYYCTATPTVARSRSSQQLYWYNVDLATIDSSSATTVLLHLLQLDLDLARYNCTSSGSYEYYQIQYEQQYGSYYSSQIYLSDQSLKTKQIKTRFI